MSNAVNIQQIFDQAEIIIDNLGIGLACLAALEAALLQEGARPTPVITAIRHYLDGVRTGADRIARLAAKLPET